MLLKALQSTIMLIINIENRNSLYENGKKITYIVFQGESMIL